MPKTATVLVSRDEVHQTLFSPEGREKVNSQYPQLDRREIDARIEELVPLAESATVFRFFPALLDGSLREVSLQKQK